MTSQQHPITLPPELVKQWLSLFYGFSIAPGEAYIDIATQAARWGLEACCEWLKAEGYPGTACRIWAAMRPKSLSLKEQALASTNAILNDLSRSRALLTDVRETLELNRRALEALPND